MTANSSKLQSLLWDDEASWGENVTSMSGAKKITITKPINPGGLTHEMLEPGRVTQYLQEGTAGIPGAMGGSFNVAGYLCGHGSTTSGATSATDLGNFLGWILGANAQSFANGTTVSGGASTTTNIVTTASGTGTLGGMFRLGGKGDGGGDGQWNVISTHTLTDLVPKFAVPAAPSAAAVVYSAENIYVLEDPASSAISSYRTQIFTANNQYICHGTFPQTFSLTGLGPTEIPSYEAGLGVSWWAPSADTFPETTSLTTHTPAPVAAGSFMIQDYGTTTRNAYSFRALSIDITLGVVPLYGPDSVSPYGKVVGARRVPTKIMINGVVDAGAASTTPAHFTDWLTNGAKHILGSLSVGIGNSVGFYAPCCFWRGNRPTQMESDGLNRIPISFEACCDTGGTTALTRSALRIGLA